ELLLQSDLPAVEDDQPRVVLRLEAELSRDALGLELSQKLNRSTFLERAAEDRGTRHAGCSWPLEARSCQAARRATIRARCAAALSFSPSSSARVARRRPAPPIPRGSTAARRAHRRRPRGPTSPAMPSGPRRRSAS